MPSTNTPPRPWADLKIAIVGGDEREQEITRRAIATGARVAVYGFPWPAKGIAGAIRAESAREALAEADIAIFPIPGIATDGSLFATEKIIPDRNLLACMKPRSSIILGRADSNLKGVAESLGIALHEYEHDQELMLLRAPAIVEAAIALIVENTEVTIHGASLCVAGHGNIGAVLTRSLLALGGRVTVAARNPVQRAAAHTLGARSITLEEMKVGAGSIDVLLSTAPVPELIDRSLIDKLPRHCLVMDLTAPPGSCDLDYVRASGRLGIWARGLGRRAPITVGASQWLGISRRIDELLREVRS